MSNINEQGSNVFGGVEFGNGSIQNNENINIETAQGTNGKNLPVKRGFWTKFKNFWLQDIDWNREIRVELTPYQQKVEDEINEFLHQEITFEKVHDFLFQEIKSGKRKTEV